MLIQNFDQLVGENTSRVDLLTILESGIEAIQPEQVINTLPDLSVGDYERVFLLGFGKGSAGLSKMIEEKIADKLTAGWVIDLKPEQFKKIKFTLGTHPLPSEENVNFTRAAWEALSGLTEKDLVIIVICGGGSAMLTLPYNSLDQIMTVNKELLKSGANISEMNTVRKKLDQVKGGGLAKHLFPASVAALIFSDVPGNDLAVIASGPTVMDPTTVDDAWNIVEKYKLTLNKDDLVETPKEEQYFQKINNVLALSNLTALEAMQKKAQELGYTASIITDHIQGEARVVGKEMVEQITKQTESKVVLLAGGETTVTATGSGQGGRNQEVVMGALATIAQGQVISSIASDGWDNSEFAGAVGDQTTVEKAKTNGVDIQSYLTNNDSFHFFEKVGDGIKTGRLESNVSDLIAVLLNR